MSAAGEHRGDRVAGGTSSQAPKDQVVRKSGPRSRSGSSSTSTSLSTRSARDSAHGNMSAPTQGQVNGNGTRDKLPPLQASAEPNGEYNIVEGDDPRSFDLLEPSDKFSKEFSLETLSRSLFSREHLQVIFADPTFILRFTTFLGAHRPQSVSLLVHYLDSLKSIRAIHYANAICEGLDSVEGLEFTQQPVQKTVNSALEARASAAFDALAREELPAFICHQYISVVSASIAARVTGSLLPHLREASEGLAEVFCLTDPSRPDNPIVFASEGKRPVPTPDVCSQDQNSTEQHNMAWAIFWGGTVASYKAQSPILIA